MPRVSKLVGLIVVVCLAIGCENETPAVDPAIPSAETATGSIPPKGPDEYWVKFNTTRGDVIIEVHRDWSPYGADRFYELVKSGFFDGCKFFRVAGFVVQFGLSGDPHVNAKWRDATIPYDKYQRKDPNRHSNKRGYVTFAKTQAPNSRTTQIFINCVDNQSLDRTGFTPFGIVLSGMSAIDELYSGYGEEPTGSQDRIESEGDAYLNAAFPRLDSIRKATVLPSKPDLPKQEDDDKKAGEKKPGETKANEKKASDVKPSASPPAPAKKPAG